MGLKWFSNNELFFISPVIVFGIFIIITNTRWYKKINNSNIRRIYYLLCFIWSFKFILLFYTDITSLVFNSGDTKVGNQAVANDLNIVWCIAILFIIFAIWDFLFISCRTITDISFKNFSVKTEEYKEFEKTTISKTEDLDILTKVLEIEYKMISEMEDYIASIPELRGFKDYNNLIKKYGKLREDIKIECYEYETEGINKFKIVHNHNNKEYSTIRYCLDKYYVCTPDNDKGKDELLTLIKTKFSDYDILVVIIGNRVMPSERRIIQHIVSYFDSLINIDILNTKINASILR